MKDIIIRTLFGAVSLSISDPDSDGKCSGVIDWSELRGPRGEPADKDDESVDAIESIILAHACAGVDVESEAYVEGINTALEAIDNNSEDVWIAESHWDDHPQWPVYAWQHEVSNGDTRLGYSAWVNENLAQPTPHDTTAP